VRRATASNRGAMRAVRGGVRGGEGGGVKNQHLLRNICTPSIGFLEASSCRTNCGEGQAGACETDAAAMAVMVKWGEGGGRWGWALSALF
jgi:hypothetical protein